MKKLLLLPVLSLSLLVAVPFAAQAATDVFGPNSGDAYGVQKSQDSFGNSVFALKNPLGATGSLCKLIKVLLNIIILLGIPVATFFVVFAGFKLVLARGRPAELEKAKANLFYTVVGIAIFLGAWLLAQVISNTIAALGIQILGSCS